MFTVSSYIIKYLKNSEPALILPKEEKFYTSGVIDTIFKFYYKWIFENGSYFYLAKKTYPETLAFDKNDYNIINYIKNASSIIDTPIVANTLIAIFRLCTAGTFPNNWLKPTKEMARATYLRLEKNPTFLNNLIDYALGLVKPITLEAIDEIEKFSNALTIPIIALATVLSIYFFKK